MGDTLMSIPVKVKGQNMNAVVSSNLPAPVERRGITEDQWRTAMNNLFPGASAESVIMVFDYCRARGLDPMKKPCHIVPMRVRDAKSGDYIWRDVVMAGVYEYRTTATRTGLYLGHSKPEYGPIIEAYGVKAPEWCELTVYRWNKEANQRTEFPVRIYFSEVVALSGNNANSRWSRAPNQMLTKCAEAAALREAFPDELGGTHTDDEMRDQVLEGVTTQAGDGSGRPDTSAVDFELRDKWYGDIVDVINADRDEYDIADKIREIADELNKFPELYTAVLDKLVAERGISKTNWKKTLKHFRPDPVPQVAPKPEPKPEPVKAKPAKPAAPPVQAAPAPQGSDDDVF